MALSAHILKITGALMLLACGTVAQIQIGTINVMVEDPSGARLTQALLTLTNSLSGYHQSIATNARGEAAFNNVPFGRYTLQAQAAGFQTSALTVEVRSNVVVGVAVTLSVATARESMTVATHDNLVSSDSSRSETVIGRSSVIAFPGVNRSRRLQDLLATTAGWSAEDNGLLHVRGADDGVLFVVDGVPVADRWDALAASAFDLSAVESVRVITGNIPAEFGGRSGAVVTLQPRSGIDSPLGGAVNVGVGSFVTRDLSAELGGGFRQRFGFFVSGTGIASHRFLDPIDPRNLNNRGGAGFFNARVDWHPTAKDILLINASGGGKGFRVPNDFVQERHGQRQRQELADGSVSVGWQRAWSAHTVSNAAWFFRRHESRLFGSADDTPLFAAQDRSHARQGVIVSLSHVRRGHDLKFGLEASHLTPREFFTFAVTDPDEARERDFSDAALAFTPERPFIFRDRRTLAQAAWYAQDSFSPFKNFTVNLGLRYDRLRMLLTEHYAGPRIGAAYFIARTRTALRASFNRLFQPPQVENLLLAASDEARRLSPFADENGGGALLRAERTAAYEVGAAQDVGGLVRLDVAFWRRTFRNVNDPNVFFSSTVVFPNTVARGWARGIDVRIDLTERRGWSAYASYTNARAQQIGPINGGLFLTEEFIEIKSGTRFTPDHDIRNAIAFGATYRHSRTGWWASFSGRHQSGVPLEVNDERLAELREAPGAELVDFERRRVKPYTTLNFSAGTDLLTEGRMTLSAQLDVQNLANARFAYNFGNPFSGTHFGYPRLWGGRVKLTFR